LFRVAHCQQGGSLPAVRKEFDFTIY